MERASPSESSLLTQTPLGLPLPFSTAPALASLVITEPTGFQDHPAPASLSSLSLAARLALCQGSESSPLHRSCVLGFPGFSPIAFSFPAGSWASSSVASSPLLPLLSSEENGCHIEGPVRRKTH